MVKKKDKPQEEEQVTLEQSVDQTDQDNIVVISCTSIEEDEENQDLLEIRYGTYNGATHSSCYYKIHSDKVLFITPETEDALATITLPRAYALEVGLITEDQETPEQKEGKHHVIS